MEKLKLLAIAMVLFGLIDFLWLGFLASHFYVNQLGELPRMVDGKMRPLLGPAFVVYLCLGLGVVFFVLPQLTAEDGLLKSFLIGAFLGIVIYGVYDMTNYSTLRNWPPLLSFVDMVWGGVLCGLVTLGLRWIPQ